MVSGWNIIMRGPLQLVSTPPPPQWLRSSEGRFDNYFLREWPCLTFDLKNISEGYDPFFSGSMVNLQHPLLAGRGRAVAIKWINSQ